MAYLSTSELKAWLKITTSGDDALLAEAIADAQAYIDSRTGRTFEASADTTRRFDAVANVSGRTLMLDADLAATPTTVTNGDGVVIPSSAFVLDPTNSPPYFAIRLKAASGYTWRYITDPEDAISVVGKWAYSTTAPQGIKRICRRIAVWYYRQKDTNADLDRPMATADGTVLIPSRIPYDAEENLRLFRRVTM